MRNTSPADYIREYAARKSPFSMVAPWRHENRLIRALYWKQECWAQAALLANCANPSAEFDVAFDAMFDADEKWEAIIRDAWSYRAVSRDLRVAA